MTAMMKRIGTIIRLFIRECESLIFFLKTGGLRTQSVTFYSEHSAYRKFFEGVIREILAGSNLEVCCITSDPEDTFFSYSRERFKVFYMKNLLPFLVPFISSKAFIMTMPDLHRYHMRRSEAGAHHFYLFHALMSTHMVYRQGAFDHYDTIFCVGPHHIEEIRRTESLYGLKAKNLVESGYPLLDDIYKEHECYLRHHSDLEAAATATCLIAPSWAPDNIIESCLEPVVKNLVQKGYRVIIRPHPEYLKRKPYDWADRIKALRSLECVEFEANPASEESLHTADVLITDWSGIALEYAFGTERPVLFIDTPRKVNNAEYGKLDIEPLEVKLRNQIGLVLSLDAVDRICETVEDLLKRRAQYQETIVRCRTRHVYHFGESAVKTADYLIRFCEGQDNPLALDSQKVSLPL